MQTSEINAGFAAKLSTIKPVVNGVSLTAEQAQIIEISKEIEAERDNGQRVLVIGAGAGTGKTFILKQLEAVLSGTGEYTAFNRSLVEESKTKFTRANCSTQHGLAFRAVGRKFQHRLRSARVKSHQIAAKLGIEDYYVELPECIEPLDDDGKPATRRLKASFLAGQVSQVIKKFCQSADPEITEQHFSSYDGLDEPNSTKNSDKVRAYLLKFAKKMWEDLSSETGSLPFFHDVYVKLWQLGQGPDRPVIAADYILLDEAQDTAPVMLNVLKRQTHAMLILVGDDNQQIYRWRGAVNAMSCFENAPRKLLSQSFRFGQSVADVANSVLTQLDNPTDLVMRGLESIPTRVCAVDSPRCYLYRTNAGAVARLMKAIEEGKRAFLIGGTKDVMDFCTAADDLQQGRGTSHQDLGCFSSWSEVQAYVQEDEGADLQLMVRLVDSFGAQNIYNALENMPVEQDADITLCTAHKSKGREWKTVKLGQDFPLPNRMSDDDRRLIYVAATRAQEELDITVCPTFCGGWDKKGGEDSDGAVWIDGIEVNYTAPMPSEEELSQYRAGIAAKQASTTATATTTAKPTTTADAKPTTSATGNGFNSKTPDGYTWANMEGQWMVRGPANKVGERVTVVRKNGSKSQENLRGVGKKLGEVWFYTIK